MFPAWSAVERIQLDTTLLPRYPKVIDAGFESQLFFQTFRNASRGGMAAPDSIYAMRITDDGVPSQAIAISRGTNASTTRATFDSHNIWHVAFGQADLPNANGRPVEPNEILYSNAVAGKWSKPSQLYKARSGIVVLSSPFVTAGDGSLHLAWFALRDSTLNNSQPTLLYRRRLPGKKWSEVVNMGNGMSPVLQAAPNGDLFLTFVRTGGTKPSMVQTLRTVDQGETWHPVDSVQRSAGAFTALRMAASKQGKIAVVWGVDQTRDGTADTFFSTIASDGIHWSTPVQIFEPDAQVSFTFDIAFDAEEQLHLVFDRSPGLVTTPRYLQESVYADGQWHGPHDILGLRNVSTGVNLTRMQDDRLLVSLYAADAPGGPGMVRAILGSRR